MKACHQGRGAMKSSATYTTSSLISELEISDNCTGAKQKQFYAMVWRLAGCTQASLHTKNLLADCWPHQICPGLWVWAYQTRIQEDQGQHIGRYRQSKALPSHRKSKKKVSHMHEN
ncbi:hypothetical protein AMECASPLE_038529 [Ameca splendens]|uniref:Uncharacterized protein n=1 Tax=Ameca splendens TaxID=208324 RepID=A0ABV0YJB8_9TELE